MRKTFELENNRLTLHVAPVPMGIRGALICLTAASVLAPLTVLIYSLATGGNLRFGFMLSVIIFGLIGFYFLRMTLWNTYGKEVIVFGDHTIDYSADYKWFRDRTRSYSRADLKFDVQPVGYGEDNMGILIIYAKGNIIQCVVKLPLNELVKLISILTALFATEHNRQNS